MTIEKSESSRTRSLWDPSLKTLAILGVLAEVIHVLNALFVKYRWTYWPVNSFLDSYVIHTVMFYFFARYFRDYSLIEAVLFFVARVFAEGYLPTSLGGLMDLKTHEEVMDGTFQDCAWLTLMFGFWLTLTFAILMRGSVFHPMYLGLVAWAVPTTFMMASRYLFAKSSLFYWTAHFANFISFNPALVHLALGCSNRSTKQKQG